jgi:hypothetical protein
VILLIALVVLCVAVWVLAFRAWGRVVDTLLEIVDGKPANGTAKKGAERKA